MEQARFIPIHLETWARKPYYEHYLNRVRCTFSMTANVDITRLRNEVKHRGIKLYPALIYMISTVVNRHRELRTCLGPVGQGQLGLGYWETMSPGYTVFHKEDKTFSSLWTAYSTDFSEFYGRYLDDLEQFGNARGLFPKTNEPPNTFPVSSIPWASFTGFNLNVFNEGTFMLPIFTMGKYFTQGEAAITMLPVAVQLHHAVCDGYHAGVMFEELQRMTDDCKNWLANWPRQ
ncbi:type A chloramphenicol O-acetyltransferase [Fontibacillus sp. BL9]|uniref:type A chloramphenicol O-acetyltransferase n=1 Tax=Fontibacillus sp. BL9 TaxID=3389971 RepID=UPI00397C62D0